jgi:two-component system response regulator CpxR
LPQKVRDTGANMTKEARQQGAAAVGQKSAILLIDDDVELCALMKEYFTRNGFTVESAHRGRDGLTRAVEERHQIVILDAMLPVLDGFEVLRQLRRRSSVPVIMLTARTHERDRIAGLNIGADDYLPKPFSPDELLARVRAVLRRYNKANLAQPEILRVAALELNASTRVLRLSGKIVDLTETEFEILELLMRTPGRVVTRDEITAAVHQRESSPFERSLDVHVSHLRRKVEQHGAPSIRTVRGRGYVIAH